MHSADYVDLGYSSFPIRGGRSTKWKGRDDGIADQTGAVSHLSRGALAAGLALGGAFLTPSVVWAGTCTQAGGAGVWTCAGIAGGDTTQTITAPTMPVSAPIVVTVTGDFGLSVAGGDGIRATASVNGANIDAGASTITSGSTGIFARNYGGALSITSTGTVTGASKIGIDAINGPAGTDLAVTAKDSTGEFLGIFAVNQGRGALSVTSTGSATGAGTNGYGIGASNSANGTDLTVTAKDSTGGDGGIIATNGGRGALSVTSTGTATGAGANGYGVRASNSANGTDLTVTAKDSTGEFLGIFAVNQGRGGLSVTSTGSATGTGTNGYGIRASNSANGTDLTVTAKNSTGEFTGVVAVNRGAGALNITSTSAIGRTGDGIHAVNNAGLASNAGTNLTIVSDVAQGGDDGVDARNYGNGTLSITSNVSATGTSSHGIAAYQFSGTTLAVMAKDASGGIDGIRTLNNGTGPSTVKVSGNVRGGNGAGIATFTNGVDVKLTTIDVVGPDAKVSSASGLAIWNNAGDSVLNVVSGGKIVGAVMLDYGSDIANFNGPNTLDGVTLLDGGDDVGSGDGMIDTLSITDWSGNRDGARIINWEVININAGTVGFSDGAISAGVINVNGSGTLDGLNNLAVTGSVAVNAGSRMVIGTTPGNGTASISGKLTNVGTVDFRSMTGTSAAGDRLTVGGNYAGAVGNLRFDTVLGNDSSATDQMVVTGNLTGTSLVTVNNVGGTGSLTSGDGIKLVDVTGTSSGLLTLNSPNQRIDVGAFRYTLNLGGVANPADQGWYLRSRARDIVSLAETFGRLGQDLAVATLGTLHERAGEQEHLGQQASATNAIPGGLWGRALGSDYSANMTSAAYGDVHTNGKFGGLQMGLDFVRWGGSGGSRTLLGAYGGYLWSQTDDSQWSAGRATRMPVGTTHSDGGFVGAYLTHYAHSGWYADLVLQGNWLTHKASAVDGTTLRTKGNTWLASLEVGKPFELGGGFKLEPQAQVIYGNSSLDGANDSIAIANSWSINDIVTGRAGFRIKRTLDYTPKRKGGRFTAYLKGNLWGRLLGDDTVLMVGTSAPGSFQTRNVWGDVGFGTTFSISSTAEFFFSGDVEFGLDSDRTGLSGHTGFRMQF